MDAATVAALVRHQRQALQPSINGIDLERAFISPELITALDPYRTQMKKCLWVVARVGGFAVAYDSRAKTYSLLETDPVEGPYLIGEHGSLKAALEAM